VLHYPWPLDEAAMAEGARFFEGTRDFTSFAASSGSEDDDKDCEMNREIYRSEIIGHSYAAFGTQSEASAEGKKTTGAETNEAPREIHYEVHGKSFLRYMVRKIVGTLLEVGKGRLKPTDIPSIFELKDRSRSGPTVGPEGLYLVSFEYPDPTASLAHERPHIRTEIG
jgi:tRNA pseudouridine38-40 synthase